MKTRGEERAWKEHFPTVIPWDASTRLPLRRSPAVWKDRVGGDQRTAREVLPASLPACPFWDEAWRRYYPLIPRLHKDTLWLEIIIRRPRRLVFSSCCIIASHIFTSGISVWFMVTRLLKAKGEVYFLKCALPLPSTLSFRVVYFELDAKVSLGDTGQTLCNRSLQFSRSSPMPTLSSTNSSRRKINKNLWKIAGTKFWIYRKC